MYHDTSVVNMLYLTVKVYLQLSNILIVAYIVQFTHRCVLLAHGDFEQCFYYSQLYSETSLIMSLYVTSS